MRLPTTALLLTGALAHAQATTDDKILTVKTTSGTYTGLVNASVPDVNQWLGIPYGRPPVGALRFMPPQPSVDHGAGLSATAYKPICYQDSGNKTGIFWDIVPEFQNQDEQSEDCLYLNIWAPRKGPSGTDVAVVEKKLPVIIWVCGGGFKEGGGHAPYQVPDHWIQRTQTHLVVAFNYRLNIFGFPGTEMAKKNAGLLDVRLVVEWARDNVAGFGGDPDRMVLYGQSAGGGAVFSYAYSYPTDPIVSGFIASSAGASTNNPADTNPSFQSVAEIVGCGNLTAAAELACMQKVDPVVLRDAVVDNKKGFRPIVDDVTMFTNLTERLEKGLVAKKPLITGFTYNEMGAFGAAPSNTTTAPAAPSNSTASSGGLACGAKREATARAAYNLTTYSYMYSGNFSNVTPLPQLGGMHSSDIPMVFGTHHLFRGNSTEFQWQTSFAMQSFWVTFAANSSADPRDHLGTAWPRYTPTDQRIVVFGNETLGAAYVAPEAAAQVFSGAC
ncbi:acetylcholinesterase [Podospora conica]|nr:acetylcholinesterase [Schizothecium conicum]